MVISIAFNCYVAAGAHKNRSESSKTQVMVSHSGTESKNTQHVTAHLKFGFAYLPSLPLYARIPESTLTPAPVMTSAFLGFRNVAIRSAAAWICAELGGRVTRVVEPLALAMFNGIEGTDIRIVILGGIPPVVGTN